jgi:hypothetical protein
MTIWNEAVRLFFAVSALILVGMLSAPMGGTVSIESEDTKEVASVEKKANSKSKDNIKLAERKAAKKLVLKKG